MTLFRMEAKEALCDGGCGLVVSRQVAVKPNGEPFGAGSPWLCPACEARARQEEADHLEAARAARAKLDAESRAEIRRKRAHDILQVPPLYQGATWETWHLHGDAEAQALQDRLRERGRNYCRKWPQVPSLVILRGEPGTGKGRWAWTVAQALAEDGYRGQVVKCADMVRSLRASWKNKEADSEEVVLKGLRTLDFLVVDEVSRHAFYGDSVHQHLYDVLDHRMEWARPTLLTTNETVDGLQEVLRPALWDRVFAGGGVLDFGTVSYRKGGAK